MSNNLFLKLGVQSENTTQKIKSVTSSFDKLSNVTKTTGSNFAKVYTNTKKVNSAFSNLTKDGNRTNKMLTGMTKSFSSLNVVMGATKLVFLARSMYGLVETAMSMIETNNLFAVSLGSSRKEAEAYIDTLNDITGLDPTNLKSTMGTFALLARSMGINNSNAEVLSRNMVKLGLDLASLTNVDISQVMGDLRSGLIGQSETVYKYGIDVTEASIKQEAMNMGIEKSVRNMSQGEKMALRYAVMLRQTGLAQGDFARTIEQPANQLRILKERLATLARSIGSIFIPALSAVLPYLNALVQLLIKASQSLATFFGYEVEDFGDFGSIGATAEDNAESIDKMGKAAKNATLGIDELNVISPTESSGGGEGVSVGDANAMDFGEYDNMLDMVTSKSDVIAMAMESQFLALVENIRTVLGGFAELFSPVMETFSTALPEAFNFLLGVIQAPISQMKYLFYTIVTDLLSLVPAIVAILNGPFVTAFTGFITNFANMMSKFVTGTGEIMTGLWNVFIFPILQKLITEGVPLVMSFSGQVINSFSILVSTITDLLLLIWRDGLRPLFEIVATIFNDIIDILVEFWEVYGMPIFTKFNELIIILGDTFTNIWNDIIGPVLKNLMDNVDWLWSKHLKPLLKNIMDFVGVLIECALDIINKFIMPIVDKFVKYFGPMIAWAFNVVVDVVGTSIAMLLDILSGIITVLKGIVKFIAGVFTGDWEKAWEGIKDIFAGIWEVIWGIIKGIINSIIDLINGMVSAIVTAMNIIVRSINSFKIEVPDWVPGIGGEVYGFNLKEFTSPEIPKLARGGMLERGTVFEAGESGKSEMLGSFNNKTTVMPLENTDFVGAMYNAVYNAVMDGQEQGGQVIENVLNLDGEVIYRNQQSVTRARGLDFGMGVFAK